MNNQRRITLLVVAIFCLSLCNAVQTIVENLEYSAPTFGVLIHGTGFGTVSCTVTLSPNIAGTPYLISPTTIYYKYNTKQTTAQTIKVTQTNCNGQGAATNFGNGGVTVQVITISPVLSTIVGTNAGQEITEIPIRAPYFETVAGQNTVELTHSSVAGKIDCTPTIISSKELRCPLPQTYTAGVVSAKVNIVGFGTTSVTPVYHLTPVLKVATVTSVELPVTSLAVQGNYFAAGMSFITDGTTCASTVVTGSTLLNCTFATAPTVAGLFTVTVRHTVSAINLDSTEEIVVNYRPSITGAETLKDFEATSAKLTIVGIGFNGAASVLLTPGDIACTGVTSDDETDLKCNLPAGLAVGPYFATITVNGVESVPTRAVSIRPSITAATTLLPAGSPYLTIKGAGFSEFKEKNFVFIEPPEIVCTVDSVTGTKDQIVCSIPTTGIPFGLSVNATVSVNGVASLKKTVATTPAPPTAPVAPVTPTEPTPGPTQPTPTTPTQPTPAPLSGVTDNTIIGGASIGGIIVAGVIGILAIVGVAFFVIQMLKRPKVHKPRMGDTDDGGDGVGITAEVIKKKDQSDDMDSS